MDHMSNNCCAFEEDLLPRVLPPLLLLEFVLGVLGNGVALWIFYFHVKPWKNSTVFLFNLALADFLLNVALPFRAIYYLNGKDWIFGDPFCRITLFMLAMNRGGSIFFLTAVAVDRYLRVVHPHHPVNFMAISKTVYTACALWALTISLTAHLLTKSHLFRVGRSTQCDSFLICPHSWEESGPMWHKSVFVFSFYLPLAVILFCSFCIIMRLRKRQLDKHSKIQRALRFIVVVVVMFVICFLPSNITSLVIWVRTTGHNKNCSEFQYLDTAFYITISLTYLNSMLDPVVYYFSSPIFKKIYKRAVRITLRKKEESGAPEDRTRDSGSQTLSQL
ncbi:hydroxycarboxylic acid receptor 3-like [Megalops cyprinoides]|uniref:hydroxycarboxylic acid receptor 3-like n=1 Tax=Megalops cyprinoides TaxID=118141 RepID=UPI0018650814|nr:hydroxycarboxylic acid receptor 3-like [Megalops cyprinoides]